MNPTVQLAKMWQQRMERWLSKRIPDSGVFRLDMSNIFIFPSHFGRLYLLLCIGLFILGSNYQNNLILIFCYFLVALFLVSLFSSFANFAHLKVQLGKTNSVFAGEDLGLPLWLEHKSQGPLQQHMQGRLHFRFWQQRSQQSVDLMAMENPVSLSLATEKRGWLNLPRAC